MQIVSSLLLSDELVDELVGELADRLDNDELEDDFLSFLLSLAFFSACRTL